MFPCPFVNHKKKNLHIDYTNCRDSMLLYPFSKGYTIQTEQTVKLCCPPVDNRTLTDLLYVLYGCDGITPLLENKGNITRTLMYIMSELSVALCKHAIQRCSKRERWLIVESWAKAKNEGYEEVKPITCKKGNKAAVIKEQEKANNNGLTEYVSRLKIYF